VRTIDT